MKLKRANDNVALHLKYSQILLIKALVQRAQELIPSQKGLVLRWNEQKEEYTTSGDIKTDDHIKIISALVAEQLEDQFPLQDDEMYYFSIEEFEDDITEETEIELSVTIIDKGDQYDKALEEIYGVEK